MLCSKMQACAGSPVHGRRPPVSAFLLNLLKLPDVSKAKGIHILRETNRMSMCWAPSPNASTW